MVNNRFLEAAEKWKNDEISHRRKISGRGNLENVLVFSSRDEIYVLDNNGLIKKIGERDGRVNKFCLNDGKIYDASGDSIFETLKNKEVVHNRGHYINSLCSYNNILYDATLFGINESLKSEEIVQLINVEHLCPHNKNLYYSNEHEIFVLGKDEKIARRDYCISDLSFHEGLLYDLTSSEICNTFSEICNTFTNKVLIKGKDISKMCSHNGILYYTDGSKIFTNKRVEEIAQRESQYLELCFHNGKLYDFGRYTPLMKTETGEVIVNKEGIQTAESFPRKLFVDAGVLN